MVRPMANPAAGQNGWIPSISQDDAASDHAATIAATEVALFARPRPNTLVTVAPYMSLARLLLEKDQCLT